MDNRTFFNQKADTWDTTARHDHVKIARILEKAAVKPADRVLDLGCGTGVLIPHLRALLGRRGKICALDVSERMLTRARANHGTDRTDYVNGDFYEFQADAPFDLIIAYSCFPHFHDHAAFFEKCRALLAGHGRLVIAHGDGKSKINAVHRRLESSLESRVLAPASDVTIEARAFGFIEREVIDDEECYLIVVENRMATA